VLVVLMHDRMPAFACKQPAIDRVGSNPGYGHAEDFAEP